eukprot:comp23315_c2_seq1/m.38325 comp23315_c2_seq1/g.38325  ORF comp23315_c2_seq1/g.38325 comp23315_c2_seq1/m.38325 type:complete len:588 (-) comp23315_c2_seq1:314-2077(-)
MSSFNSEHVHVGGRDTIERPISGNEQHSAPDDALLADIESILGDKEQVESLWPRGEKGVIVKKHPDTKEMIGTSPPFLVVSGTELPHDSMWDPPRPHGQTEERGRDGQFSLFAFPISQSTWQGSSGNDSRGGDQRGLYNPMAPGPFTLFGGQQSQQQQQRRPEMERGRDGGWDMVQGLSPPREREGLSKKPQQLLSRVPGRERKGSVGESRTATSASAGVPEALWSSPSYPPWESNMHGMNVGRQQQGRSPGGYAGSGYGAGMGMGLGLQGDGLRRHSYVGGVQAPVVRPPRHSNIHSLHDFASSAVFGAGGTALERAETHSWRSEGSAQGAGSDLYETYSREDVHGHEMDHREGGSIAGYDWFEGDEGEEGDRPAMVKERKRGKRGGKRFRCDRGLRCHSAQCKRTHPPGWKPCPNMVTGGCTDPECPASCHREMCENFFTCTRKLCCYGHSWGRAGLDSRGSCLDSPARSNAAPMLADMAGLIADMAQHRQHMASGGGSPDPSILRQQPPQRPRPLPPHPHPNANMHPHMPGGGVGGSGGVGGPSGAGGGPGVIGAGAPFSARGQFIPHNGRGQVPGSCVFPMIG